MEKKFKIKDRLCEKVVKREIDESEKTFVPCINCERPYKRTAKYPNEVCRSCGVEGTKLEEVIKT